MQVRTLSVGGAKDRQLQERNQRTKPKHMTALDSSRSSAGFAETVGMLRLRMELWNCMIILRPFPLL
ncbi:hypothetical protein SKAU_G00388570 [Synaphobranchus kaupii]|uniref:Uncharacterized protein n=1 Tax=Synaphobranchus kaupii TaxID=118154 RepID=A0A9Q1EB33_SYNKA|nr:hypothetical protein SKAU_G00388570 [Synaphobranchus kaupii]